jgi:SAM-dependent methyltransferase
MNVTEAELERAFAEVTTAFPFPGYFPLPDTCLNVGRTVARNLPAGASVLDFGAGPADKTAMLAALGFDCTAMDDLSDEWHQLGGAREKILAFAKEMGMEYVVTDGESIPVTGKSYDMVMLNDVLEHLHDSPRDLLNALLAQVKDEGLLFITVPNHVNLRKRLAVLRGRTSHPDYKLYYWYPGSWRGHVREYTKGDCEDLAAALGLTVVELDSVHHMLEKVPERFRRAYVEATRLIPGVRDTWSMVARKPKGWTPQHALSDEQFRAMTGLTSWGEAAH